MTSDMKPTKHIEYLTKRALKRMWTIRRLKGAGCCNEDLIMMYESIIRSVLETACPVFHPQLNIENTTDLERIQKIFCKIVLAEKYEDYNEACTLLNLETLSNRREALCLNFGWKCVQSQKHRGMFPKNETVNNNQRNPSVFSVPFAHTDRYAKTSIPYIANLLNKDAAKCKNTSK